MRALFTRQPVEPDEDIHRARLNSRLSRGVVSEADVPSRPSSVPGPPQPRARNRSLSNTLFAKLREGTWGMGQGWGAQRTRRRAFCPRSGCSQCAFGTAVIGLPILAGITLGIFFQLLSVILLATYFCIMLPVLWTRARGRSPQIQAWVVLLLGIMGLCVFVAGVFMTEPLWLLNGDLNYALLGGLTNSSVRVLLRGHEFGSATIQVRAPGSVFVAAETTVSLGSADDWTAVADMSGLAAGTRYTYTVSFAGGTSEQRILGGFRTMPAEAALTDRVRFVSSSCAQRKRVVGGLPLTGFRRMRTLAPDFGLFLGDAIYADVPWGLGTSGIAFGTRDELYGQEYRGLLADPDTTDYVRAVPTFFMYDDHEVTNDYAGGNASSTFQTALRNWQRYLGAANPPSGAGLERGAQFTFTAGPRAHFFVADTRYYRSEERGEVCGPAQLAEIKAWLLQTQAATPAGAFKFLVSSVPMTRNQASPAGGWNCGCPDCGGDNGACPRERDDLLRFIATNGITSVVVISGDSHKPGVFQLAPEVLEVSASPVSAISPLPWNNDEDPVLYERGLVNTAFAMFEVEGSELRVQIYAGGVNLLEELLVLGVTVVCVLWFMALGIKLGFERRRARNPAFKPANYTPVDLIGWGPWTEMAVSVTLLAAVGGAAYLGSGARGDQGLSEPDFEYTLRL